jgi:hypothetical protein
MKQTAVGFLMDKLFDSSTMIEEQIQWFHQAAQMEKEQIEDAYMEGGDWESLPQPRFDNYFNQTFNTEER